MITREYLANYPYLKEVIERDKKKLKELKENPPTCEVGKVYGSSSSFPYLKKGFYVSSPNIQDKSQWEKRKIELEFKISDEIKALTAIGFEIDELIVNIQNPQHKLVFEYLYKDGLKQKDVAEKLYMDRSNISKIVDKYISE